MNEKITIGQLADNIARICGCDRQFAERYLKTLADEVAEQLVQGNAVTVKQVGTFRPLADAPAGSDPVSFTPDSTLAALINAPFDMFDSVELHSEVTDSMLNEIDNQLAEMETESEAEELAAVEVEDMADAVEPTPAEMEAPADARKPKTDAVESPVVARKPETEPTAAATTDAVEAPAVARKPETEPQRAPKPKAAPLVTPRPKAPSIPVKKPTPLSDDEISDAAPAASQGSMKVGLLLGFFIGLILGAVVTYWYVSDQIEQARAPYEAGELYVQPADGD